MEYFMEYKLASKIITTGDYGQISDISLYFDIYKDLLSDGVICPLEELQEWDITC